MLGVHRGENICCLILEQPSARVRVIQVFPVIPYTERFEVAVVKVVEALSIHKARPLGTLSVSSFLLRSNMILYFVPHLIDDDVALSDHAIHRRSGAF